MAHLVFLYTSGAFACTFTCVLPPSIIAPLFSQVPTQPRVFFTWITSFNSQQFYETSNHLPHFTDDVVETLSPTACPKPLNRYVAKSEFESGWTHTPEPPPNHYAMGLPGGQDRGLNCTM